MALTGHIRVLDSDRLMQPGMGSDPLTAVGGIELALDHLFDIQLLSDLAFLFVKLSHY